MSLMMGLAFAAPVMADEIDVPKGTNVDLAFDQSLSDTTAHDGQIVSLHVDKDVMVDGRTIIRAGTPVTGRITAVKKRARFGVNARIQMLIRPIKTVNNQSVPIGYKTKSTSNGKTAGAAAASVGGAVVLGPVGLVGGYFIVGKHVNVKPGDKTTVEVDQDTLLHVK
jgi:hypothetical protein